jgi:membrane-associated phospholipid phosphatase
MKKSRPLTPAEKLDLRVARAVALRPGSAAAEATAFLGALGDQPPMFSACAAVLASGLLSGERRTARAGARMLAAVAIATMAKTLVKDRIDRTRPRAAFARNYYRLADGDSEDSDLRSMPSGHTAGVVAAARAAARDYPAGAAGLAAGAAAIAAAQLPSRKHFLTDVLAGAAIGLASEKLGSLLIDAWIRPART